MGLLDEAIREHLDLKRRRGADPLEVERAEREALGPVRRAPETPPDADSEEDASTPFAYDQESDEDSWSRDLNDRAPARGSRSAVSEPDADEPDDRFSEPQPGPEDPFLDDEPELDHEPGAAATETEPPSADQAGGETIEYDVEGALGAERGREGAGADDDVLEETPEFLQDTPDHDRLWFEQRPPKDFDFDG
jgi:hypothetical protein